VTNLETSRKYWNSVDGVSPLLVGVYAMGGGGLVEVIYRHFFELKHLESIVSFNKSTRLLEMGCGTGRWAMSLAPKVNCYVGVDFSRDSLEYAEEEARRRRLTNARFCQASITEFRSSQAFDVVYFSGVSQYLEDSDMIQVLRNIRPLLLDSTVIVDRSTINNRAREVANSDGYFSIYRTPSEIEHLYNSIGFRLLYRNRSYRFLRFTGLVRHPAINRMTATVVSLTKPMSLYAMWGLSFLADSIHPVPFEGGDRSHDFFLFRGSES
jgi:2-polyprenyl-3-methyl-5-hydroxy-6-metoxy-1,4-benzoquinol methylase